jgi:hypothetical protein
MTSFGLAPSLRQSGLLVFVSACSNRAHSPAEKALQKAGGAIYAYVDFPLIPTPKTSVVEFGPGDDVTLELENGAA